MLFEPLRELTNYGKSTTPMKYVGVDDGVDDGGDDSDDEDTDVDDGVDGDDCVHDSN